MAWLPEEDRQFLDMHKGLGNSQKAEVAWLEMMGYEYEELDVRSFSDDLTPRSSLRRNSTSKHGMMAAMGKSFRSSMRFSEGSSGSSS